MVVMRAGALARWDDDDDDVNDDPTTASSSSRLGRVRHPFPLFTFRWRLNASKRKNDLPQYSQRYGRTPEWIRSWLRYREVHYTHVHVHVHATHWVITVSNRGCD